MPRLRIREANSAEDFQFVAWLASQRRDAYGGFFQDGMPYNYIEELAVVTPEIYTKMRSLGRVVYVGIVNNELAGFVLLCVRSPHPIKPGLRETLVFGVSVHPDYAGTNLARELEKYARAIHIGMGDSRMVGYVNADRKGFIRALERRGWKMVRVEMEWVEPVNTQNEPILGQEIYAETENRQYSIDDISFLAAEPSPESPDGSPGVLEASETFSFVDDSGDTELTPQEKTIAEIERELFT